MAHFAELDENNIVIRVLVISNNDLLDDDGQEQESLGIEVCQKVTGSTNRWVQTSYNRKFRGWFAGIGYAYHDDLDVFYWPHPPYSTWTLNENGEWGAPIPKPEDTDTHTFEWSINLNDWVAVPKTTSGNV